MQVSQLPSTQRQRTSLQVYRSVLQALVIRELRSRVEGHWTGVLWMLLEPLANLLVLLTLYNFRLHITSPNVELPVFLITGLLPYFMFRNLARRMPSAITANRGLYAYRQVKPIDSFVARAVVEVGLSSAVYLCTLAIFSWMGYHCVPIMPLELLVVSAVLLTLGASLGLLISVAVHNRPRVRAVINMLFFPLYILSGVLFPVRFVPLQYREWLLLNPVMHLIDLSRAYFIPFHQTVDGVNLAYPAAFTLVMLALSLSVYRVFRHQMVSKE